MSTIFGKPPHPQSPASPKQETATKAPRTPPSSPKAASAPQQDALATSPKRPPMATHAHSDLVVPRSPESPAAKGAAARRAQTEGMLGSAHSPAVKQNKADRIDAFVEVSRSHGELTPAGRALALNLFSLTDHPEGLKAYYFVHPGLPPMLASHSAIDADTYRQSQAAHGRRRVTTSGGAAPAQADATDREAISSHKDMHDSLANAAKGVARPPAGPQVGKGKWWTLQQEMMFSVQRSGDRLAAVGPNGERMVQGGIRMCRPSGADHVTLGPSEKFSYLDGGPEATAALATFCANTLLAQAEAFGEAPLRARPLAQQRDHGKIPQAETNAGLEQLCAAINARLDAAA